MAKTIRNLNSIAIPLIIQSMFNILMGIADQSISGRLSPEYYNSVSVISRFFNTIFGILGCVVILLHIKGSRLTHNRDKLIKLFNQYLITEFLIGLLFTLAFLIFGKSILSFMLGKTVFDVTNIIKYYYFYSLCTIVQLLIFTFNAYLKIIGKTKIILYGGVVATILNVSINYLVVMGGFSLFGSKIASVGFSTFLSLVVNLIIYILALKKDLYGLSLKDFSVLKIKDILIESIPHIVHELIDGSFLTLFIYYIITRRSEALLGGYSVIDNTFSYLFVPVYMYSQALITVVGEASDNNDTLRVIRNSLIYITEIFLVIVTIILLFRRPVLSFMNANVEIVNSALSFIFIYSIMIVTRAIAVIFAHALQALNKAKQVVLIDLISGIAITILAISFTNIFTSENTFIRVFLISMSIVYIIVCFVQNSIIVKETNKYGR